ncbi:MAG: energy transducer TonB [Rhodanobacteraceae bacterium]
MESTTDVTGHRRPFNWGFSVATALTLALHASAFLMIMAPVLAPHAAERIKDDAAWVHVIEPQPEPPKPPPPAPEPPQKPPTQVVHRTPTPVLQPPDPPVVMSEPSPMAKVATPPSPPTAHQSSTNVRPSARISYREKYRPQYPIQAIRMRQEGTVQLKILVSEDGNPLKIQVSHSSGYRSLDQAAIAAARQWKFNPARQDGVPRQGWVIIPIEFGLRTL